MKVTPSASATNHALVAVLETILGDTMTDTPTASDVNIMNTAPTKEEIEAAQRAVTEEIISEMQELVQRSYKLFWKAALLALSLKDASILKLVVSSIIEQVTLQGSVTTSQYNEAMAELSERMSATKAKSSESTEMQTSSVSSETTSSKEGSTSASPKGKLTL